MNEIEVKVLEVNRALLEEKILAQGGRLSFEEELRAVFFDDAEGSIIQSGGVLRLRQEGESTKLTHKLPVSSERVKIMDEKEVEVDCFDTMESILKALGYIPQLSLRKTRAEFSFLGQHLVFDQYHDQLSHIPEFLEIESETEDKLWLVMDQLGIDRDQARPWSTLDLMAHYGSGDGSGNDSEDQA